MDIFTDLVAEHAQLEAMLEQLTVDQWLSPSDAAGWTVADVMLHLAQTEEAIPLSASATDEAGWRDRDDNVDPQPVFAELTSPSGATWTFGDPSSPTRIRGTAGEFCRVGAKRLVPGDSSLVGTGPLATETLQVLRNYAY